MDMINLEARYAPIVKTPSSLAVPPNLTDYRATCAEFRWSKARAALTGLPHGDGLNIAYEAVDRHAKGPHAKRVALRWIGKSGETLDYSSADLATPSVRRTLAKRLVSVARSA